MEKNYSSLLDAFRDLNSVADEEVLLKPKVRKIVREAKEFSLRAGKNEIEDAKKFMHESEAIDEIEVIDVNADSLEHVKDNIDYVGQVILQCVKCHSNRFIEANQLEADPDNDELYNMEEECPTCHAEGKGFELLGQVGKVANEEPSNVDTDTSAEVALDNDQKGPAEVAFENDIEDVDSDDAEEVTETETEEEEDEGIDLDTELDYAPEEEDDGMTTAVTDDTDDEEFELPQLGDLFDSDKVRKDDTIEDVEDEEDEIDEPEDEEEDAAKQVKTAKPLTKKLRLPTRESLNKLRTLKLNLTEELIHRIILPESINKVIVTNTANKKIYEGMMSELPIKLTDSAIDGFNVGNGHLSCNIDLDEHEVELPLAKILNSFNDDETTKIIIWDSETDIELFNGSKKDALARFGHCQFVSLDAPKTLCIKVKDTKEDIYTDNIEDQSLSAEDELCDKIFTVNDLAKYNVDSPRSEEFWIKESIHNREDLEVLFEKYVKNTDDKKLIEQFKKTTGYKDELDEMLEKHGVKVIDQKDVNEGVSADQFTEIINIATKLGMTTLFQLQGFARKHGNVEGIELLNLLRKKASEQNNQVTEDLNKKVVSFKTRKGLSEAVSKLKAENKKYKVQRSLKENYRYDLITEAADLDFEFKPGEYEEYIEEAKNLAKQIKTWDVRKCDKLFNDYDFFKTEPQDEAEQIIFDALDARLTELYESNSKKDFSGKITDIIKDVKTYSLKKAEELYYDVFGFDVVEPQNKDEQEMADALINRIEQISTKKPVIAGEALEEDFEIEEIADLSESIDRTLLDAVQYAYGFNKQEALNWIKTATEEAKEAIVKEFKQNAKNNFYNESFEEETGDDFKDNIGFLANEKLEVIASHEEVIEFFKKKSIAEEDIIDRLKEMQEDEENHLEELKELYKIVTGEDLVEIEEDEKDVEDDEDEEDVENEEDVEDVEDVEIEDAEDVEIEEDEEDELEEDFEDEEEDEQKLKQMFEGDPQYFDEAADIIIYWYEREDNINALKDPDIGDILNLLDAASNTNDREIVAKAIGPDADFIFADDDLDEAINIKPFFAPVKKQPELEEEEIEFDAELFDEELNKYFDEAYDDTVIFKTMGGAVDVKGNVMLEGIIRSENSEADVKFTLTPKTEINESIEKHNLTETLKNTLFKVTNNLSEEVFEFKINNNEK